MAEMMNKEMSSAAAFVEGGIQDAGGDACSICLEEFSQIDPSTVTCCKHEFHLHCILEWYFLLSLSFAALSLLEGMKVFRPPHILPDDNLVSEKLPMSYVLAVYKPEGSDRELLEAVERERKIRANPPTARRQSSGAIFRHPTLGDFRLPVGLSDEELEQRIIQHLAAVAAIRSTHHRIHSSREGGGPGPLIVYSSARAAVPSPHRESEANPQGLSFVNRNSGIEEEEERGSSDLVTLSDSLKSKWSMVSARYKESIARSTRGWREKLFARNSSMMMADCPLEASSSSSSRRRREMNGGSSSCCSSSIFCCISRHRRQQQQQRESDGYTAIRMRSNRQSNNPEKKPLIIGEGEAQGQGYV